jgi:regulator of protease activity HflC (stomatin/prohibitin superfamily)
MIRFPWSLYKQPSPDTKQRRWRLRHLSGLTTVLMLAAVVVTLLFPYMAVTVPSGEVGVLWKRFTGPGIYCWCILARGTVLDPTELRDEGLHVIWPWDRLYIYDLRLQSKSEKYNAISSDGVNVTAEINIRYQLNHDSVAVFHKFIGPDYFTSLLAPEIGSQTRDVISRYTAQQVYISRHQIEDEIRAGSQSKLGAHLDLLVQPEASEQQNAERYKDALQNSIQILDTLVLSIELPAAIVAAINNQTVQQYRVTEYKYRAEREVEESKRKQIEANGIAAFQRTVSQGISDSYLRWQGIEATVALAQSSNAKIVVIGTGGRDGLPIILGNMDTPPSSMQTQKSVTGDMTPPLTSPTEVTPASASSRSDETPTGSAGSPGTPRAVAPTGPGKEPTTSGSASGPAKTDKESSSSSSLDLSDIKSMLSRLSEALRSTGSATSPATETKPKG